MRSIGYAITTRSTSAVAPHIAIDGHVRKSGSPARRRSASAPPGSPRYEAYARDILGAAKHLLGLIDDILDLSKIEAGKWELHEEPVDLHGLLVSVVRLCRGRDAAASLDIAIDAPPGLPPFLADERALKQILLNGLSNAVKFTNPGGRIRLRARRDGRGRLHLAIADTGIGIEREDISKALAPFGQIESPLARRHHGTGLGLPVAKALTELHGGRLRLKSRPGKGTVVSILLPAERFAAVPCAVVTPCTAAEPLPRLIPRRRIARTA